MAEHALMTIGALADAVGGRIVPSDFPKDAIFSSVSIDSRSIEVGALFVALGGNERDGHDFIPAAFSSGARVALAASTRMDCDGAALSAAAARSGACIVVVQNTLHALQRAARAYLDLFPRLLRIGITGSSGKTTTKELAAAMIGVEKRVVMNQGNLNSETGLPLSVFSVREDHEVGIFEMGMNRRGEMDELAAVLRPHIALITNVGTAHIGILGTQEAIAEEKKAIFSRFTGSELALIPEDDVFSDFLGSAVSGRVRHYGASSSPSFGGARSLGLDGTEILWDGSPAVLAIPGAHNLSNALAAAAIADAVGVSPKAIRKGIESVRPLFGRGEIFRGSATVVRDCYNANPESTEASIAFCDSVEWPGHRVYIIGSMLELGDSTEVEHRRIGKILAKSRADAVFLFGKETEETFHAIDALPEGRAKKVYRTDDIEQLSRSVMETVHSGDLVLLKGSRGVALERLTDALVTDGLKVTQPSEGV